MPPQARDCHWKLEEARNGFFPSLESLEGLRLDIPRTIGWLSKFGEVFKESHMGGGGRE